MANQKSNTKVVTGVVRLSYANVWEPASINGGTPKYSVSLIIPKSDQKTIDAINAAVDAAIKDGAAKFGGKIPNGVRLILCQSNAPKSELASLYPVAEINPLGDWTGGTDVDTGTTNRKLGSDMADSVTGGGLHGKDLSKADVSVNIYAFLKAQKTGKPVELCCAIGDNTVDGVLYSEIVEIARKFILELGGFEKFAEWGLF